MKLDREIFDIRLDDILPNRFQPRLTFDEISLNELATSIKEHGIIQPLVLRKLGDKYEIIAGERRYKAAAMAGLDKVPSVIVDLDDNESAEVAIIENTQRKELSALEEAIAYKRILDKGYITQDELGKKMGKSQSGIANKLRLLTLNEEVQKALLENKISERHGRSLLSIKDQTKQVEVLNEIINKRLTVRQTDELIKNITGSMPGSESSSEGVYARPVIVENKNNEKGDNMDDQRNDVVNNQVTNANPANVQTPAAPTPSFADFFAKSVTANNEAPTPAKVEEPLQGGRFFSAPLENEPVNMMPNKVEEEIIPSAPLARESVPTVEQISPVESFFNNVPKAEESTTPLKTPVSDDFDMLEDKAITEVSPIADIVSTDSNANNGGSNLRDAISEIRNLVDRLEAKGLSVDIDEADLQNQYQVTIKINKN